MFKVMVNGINHINKEIERKSHFKSQGCFGQIVVTDFDYTLKIVKKCPKIMKTSSLLFQCVLYNFHVEHLSI